MTKTNGTRICSIEECENKHYGRGWCHKHYKRWWSNGDPLKKRRFTDEPLIDRLLSKRKITESGCWEWKGYTNELGYGVIGFDGKNILVHRASWQEHNGPIQDELQVLHKCDNPPCFNPDCLFLGTNQDNIDDKMRKGRHKCPKGEVSGLSKLTEKDVRWIRGMYASGAFSQNEIALIYGADRSNVGYIVRRKTWGHVEASAS